MTDESSAIDGNVDCEQEPAMGERSSSGSSARTPLYAASNSGRYTRQDKIREIQDQSGFRLICYISGGACRIEHNDAMYFRDLLHRIDKGVDIELMLHTRGGDVDAAEKLVLMIRENAGDAKFRIVVPDRAKSAGTLMVLGADTVVMSDTSELGPIDPQMILPDAHGTQRWVSAQHYIDAFDEHAKAVNENPHDVASRIMLEKLDPVTREQCLTAMGRCRQLAETLLQQGMFLGSSGNWTATVSELIDTKRWQTHSQAITWQDASDERIGLCVNHVDPNASVWQNYWSLYCLQRLEIGDDEKLFESDYVSLKTAC